MIHLFWHTAAPLALRARLEQWQALGHDAHLWNPDELGDLRERVAQTDDGVIERDRARHLANVARWYLLTEHGGIWVDTDVTPQRPFTDLVGRSEPWSAAIGTMPTPFVCGGPVGHPLWQRTLDAALDHPHGTSPEASGGRLLRRTLNPHELELVPASFFADRDAQGRALPTPAGGRYSTHDWTTSTRRYQDWTRQQNRLRP